MKIMAAVCLLFFIWLAVRSKVRLKSRSGLGKTTFELPTQPADSIFSLALAELIATAGGIYVSLLLLFSFLDLATPGKMGIVGLQVDSLAAVSLVVALLQPIIARIFRKHVL